MSLDFTLLTVAQLWLFVVSFALTGAGLLLGWRARWKFSGWVLVVVPTALVWMFLPPRLGIGLVLAGVLVIAVGTFDERRRLTAGQQFLAQLIIASLLVAWGWTIPLVSNPFGGGVWWLGWWGSVVAVGWLVGMMNAVNWLDGVDGLAVGVGGVAFVTLAAISLLPATQDKLTLQLAMVGAGAGLAFLWANWPPARLYLGTTGVWWLAILVGLTAMVGGGKIATTTLVAAWPIVDVGLVIAQRLWVGQRPWQGDTQWHLHYRLRAAGWLDWHISLAAIVVTAVLAVAAVLLPTEYKTLVLVVFGSMLGLYVWRSS